MVNGDGVALCRENVVSTLQGSGYPAKLCQHVLLSEVCSLPDLIVHML